MEGYNSRYVVTSLFLEYYLDTEEEGRLDEVAEKASLIGYSRMIRKIRKQREQDFDPGWLWRLMSPAYSEGELEAILANLRRLL